MKAWLEFQSDLSEGPIKEIEINTLEDLQNLPQRFITRDNGLGFKPNENGHPIRIEFNASIYNEDNKEIAIGTLITIIDYYMD